MKIVTITNNKGGVAKTTTVANVAALMAKRGLKVLAIDLDPQCNLTYSLVGDLKTRSLTDAIKRCEILPITAVSKKLDLIASERQMNSIDNFLSKHRDNYLSSLIRLTADNGKYDYVIIDTAPCISKTMQEAIIAADAVYITITAEMLAVNGVDMLELLVHDLEASIDGIILTRYENRNINKTLRKAIESRYGDKVFKTAIRNNIAVVEASANGKAVIDYAPKSNAAKDYTALTNEILKKLKK